jgi:acyl-CoA dehydrogenase
MVLNDPAHMKLPFYQESHRQYVNDLRQWLEDKEADIRHIQTLTPSEQARAYTTLLSVSGWLAPLTQVGGKNQPSRPDLRTICLTREMLSTVDDLLDFAYAIHGLATAPMAWFAEGWHDSDYLHASSGDKVLVGALALSEPGCASDLGAVQTKAERQKDETYVLNGVKTWVSNGDACDYFCILARSGEGPGAMGLSFFVVPGTTPGIEMEPIDLLAPRSFATLYLKDVVLPAGSLIGTPGMGFKYAMEILDYYRVSVGSAAIGMCRRAFDVAKRWSLSRHVAGGLLVEKQFTAEKLSNMALYLESASLLVARSAWAFDCEDPSTMRSAYASMAKLYATEEAQRVIDDALQLLGASGLVQGSWTEKLYRQIRSLRIYEGTSEIQKLVIARACMRMPPLRQTPAVGSTP